MSSTGIFWFWIVAFICFVTALVWMALRVMRHQLDSETFLLIGAIAALVLIVLSLIKLSK